MLYSLGTKRKLPLIHYSNVGLCKIPRWIPSNWIQPETDQLPGLRGYGSQSYGWAPSCWIHRCQDLGAAHERLLHGRLRFHDKVWRHRTKRILRPKQLRRHHEILNKSWGNRLIRLQIRRHTQIIFSSCDLCLKTMKIIEICNNLHVL